MSSNKDEDVSELVKNDQLDQDQEPHLSADNPAHDLRTAAPEYVTPEISTDQPTGQGLPVSDSAQSTVDRTGNSSQNGTSDTVSAASTDQRLNANTPVVYSAQQGDSVVSRPVVIRQPNGIHVIRTQNCCDHAIDPNRIQHRQKPLTLKKIKILRVASIIAIFVFFPLGIPALYYSIKCEKEYHAGILRGELDTAKKFGKRSERLVIFSVMAALLVTVAVFAIVERNLMAHDEDYWKNRHRNAIMPSG